MTATIGFDIDDVLFPWSRYAHEACEAAGITNGKQITQWRFENDYGVTTDELWDVLDGAYHQGMLLRAPIEGVVEVLESLVKEGHIIALATARGTSERDGSRALVRSDTKNWLHRYSIPYHSLTFTTDKTVVQTDYFVDDNQEHYDALKAAGREAFLMDAQHNRARPFGCDRRRVFSVAHYAECVRSHEHVKSLRRYSGVDNAALAYVTQGKAVV